MSESQHNLFSHESNCTMEICAAGCAHQIYSWGWQAAQKEDDDKLMDGVLYRAKDNPTVFLLDAIGHVNGTLSVEEIEDLDEIEAPLWNAYMELKIGKRI